MINWVAKLLQWVSIAKIVVQNIFFAANPATPTKISDIDRSKYMVVMLGDKDDQAGYYNGTSGEAPVPPNSTTLDTEKQGTVTKSRDLDWVWVLCLVLALVSMLVVLWYWVYMAPTLSVPSSMVERKSRSHAMDGGYGGGGKEGMSGYGITPALANFMTKPNLSKLRRRKRGAFAYIRERTLPPVLVSAPREWREKLFRLEVSTDTSTTHGDLTMELPYKQLKIVTNQGMGDCLFLCWQRILADKGVNETVESLRGVVADAVATPERLDFLMGLYAAAIDEREVALIRDYSFMKGVESVDDLRAAIMTRAYFGDEMALDAIEAKFGIRGIVLLITGNNRISVAHRLDTDKKPAKEYALLLLDQDGVHYELVQYMDRSVMRLDQLPTRVIREVHNKKIEGVSM